MKDYQEAIDTNRLYFWCNSIGEINAVASKPACIGTEDDLPEKAKTLYQKYFDEATAARKYIVSTEDGYGLMLWLILDRYWIDVTFGDGTVSDALLSEVGKEVLSELEAKYADKHIVAYYGAGTDSDGDEAMVYVPYDTLLDADVSVESLNKLAEKEYPVFYDAVEERIRKRLETA